MGQVLALLVWLVESLVAAVPDSSTSLTAALVALAIVAVVHAGHTRGALTPGVTLATAVGRRRPTPVTSDRVTDPVHHPLRPRAPGTV